MQGGKEGGGGGGGGGGFTSARQATRAKLITLICISECTLMVCPASVLAMALEYLYIYSVFNLKWDYETG